MGRRGPSQRRALLARYSPQPPRRHSALRLRAWVTTDQYALDDAALHQELTRRRDLIVLAMRRALCAVDEDVPPPTESLSDTMPATPALYAVSTVSLTTPKDRRLGIGSAIVADYWAHRPYHGRPLPLIVWLVPLWAFSSLDRIHALDLRGSLLRQALAQSPWVAQLRRGGRRVRRFADLMLHGLEQEAVAAGAFVALDPVAACQSPYLTGLRAELLRQSHDGDARADERDRSRCSLLALDTAAHADRSGARGYTATSVERCLVRYRTLRSRGLSMRQAHARLAHEARRTPKRIEALLGDARRAERIAQVWADYCEWLASRGLHAL